MERLELYAQPRNVTGKKVKALRREGQVPGIIYGYGLDPIKLLIGDKEIERVLKLASTSTLIDLKVEGHKVAYAAVIRDVQYDPIKHNPIHVDMLALNLMETVRVQIPVTLVGTPPAIEKGGVLLQQLTELEIEALPTALVSSFEIDVSGLADIGDSLTVSDVTPPEGITILTSGLETIAQMTALVEEAIEEEVETIGLEDVTVPTVSEQKAAAEETEVE
ncbi:MAG: 50S ribosomal protein L25 [Anaerolineae bacterium]|nr:50S ribosomal protein L25 [Anaerolineae bacterium]